MKRLLAILLCLSTLLPMASCSSSDLENYTHPETLEETQETTEEKKKVTQLVVDTSAKEQLAAIPVANSSMTTDELRQLCVDTFHLMASFVWTPSERFYYKGMNFAREKGNVYGGLPYISTACGNIYRAMEYYDEKTGVLDVSAFVDGKGDFLGNACSGGAFWSWFRVVNSFDPVKGKGAYTYSCTPACGALKVGNYTSKDVTIFSTVRDDSPNKYNADNIVAENDEQTIYESYALTKIADGVVHPGHVRMVTVAPTVVRNEDGTINGEESWLGCTEQIKYVNADDCKVTQSNGISYNHQGFVDKKYTFKELYDKSYIPFTFGELIGTDPIEEAEVKVEGVEGETASLEALKTSVVKANYIISDVFLTLTAPDGSEALDLMRWAKNHHSFEMKGDWCYDEETVKALEPFAEKGDHTLTVSVQLANGERLLAYEGLLSK